MESLNFGRMRAENQLVFLNTGKLIGVQSISINKDEGAEPLHYIGIKNRRVYQVPNKQQSANVSITSFLVNRDDWLQLTGSQPVNMFILQDQSNLTNGYSLISGYMNSYSARYSYGQPTEIQASLVFYKDAGQINPIELDSFASGQLVSIGNNNYTYNSGYLISDGQSVNLTLDEINTSRVSDFTISLGIKREPIYNIGSRSPLSIKTIYPIEVSCSVSFDAPKNYSGIKLTSFPQFPKVQNISLQVNNYNSSETIASYSFPDMTMIDETYIVNVDDNVTVNRSYLGYISD